MTGKSNGGGALQCASLLSVQYTNSTRACPWYTHSRQDACGPSWRGRADEARDGEVGVAGRERGDGVRRAAEGVQHDARGKGAHLPAGPQQEKGDEEYSNKA